MKRDGQSSHEARQGSRRQRRCQEDHLQCSLRARLPSLRRVEVTHCYSSGDGNHPQVRVRVVELRKSTHPQLQIEKDVQELGGVEGGGVAGFGAVGAKSPAPTTRRACSPSRLPAKAAATSADHSSPRSGSVVNPAAVALSSASWTPDTDCPGAVRSRSGRRPPRAPRVAGGAAPGTARRCPCATRRWPPASPAGQARARRGCAGAPSPPAAGRTRPPALPTPTPPRRPSRCRRARLPIARRCRPLHARRTSSRTESPPAAAA